MNNMFKHEMDESPLTKMCYKPSLFKAKEFFCNSFELIFEAVNQMTILEADLVPFMKTEKIPLLNIKYESPWIDDATKQVAEMVNKMINEPVELFELFYEKYEDILQCNPTDLLGEMISQASLKKIEQNKEEEEDTGLGKKKKTKQQPRKQLVGDKLLTNTEKMEGLKLRRASILLKIIRGPSVESLNEKIV